MATEAISAPVTAVDTAAAVDAPPTVSIIVEFSGGLETLFQDKRRLPLSLPAHDDHGNPATVGFLVQYLLRHELRDSREELFVVDGHVRPGILVLINDADWELEGEAAYELQAGDCILFVSTLHGG